MRDITIDGRVYGRPHQSVHETSLVQKYPLGTIYEVFGKKWAYCYTAAGITIPRRGCPSLVRNPWYDSTATTYPQFGSDATTATGYEGEDWFILTFAAACDTERPVDCLQGGLITLFPAVGGEIHQYRIVGNDVSYDTTLADDTIKIYVDPPLYKDFAAIPCDGMPSMYSNVGDPGLGTAQTSFVVVSERIVPACSYFWGQIHGPAWVTPNAGWNTANTRTARFHTNGTIIGVAETDLGYQVAGYILAENSNADDAHIMLDIG